MCVKLSTLFFNGDMIFTFTNASTGRPVSDMQLIVIVCVILGTLIIATLLIVAIVALKRRDSKETKPPVQYFQVSYLICYG